MTQEQFQEHVLKELSDIKTLFIKNEEDHGKLAKEIQSVRTEIHKQFHSFLRWTIGTVIASAGVAFLIAKYIS